MNKRIATAILFGLSIALLSGCAPWVNDAIHLAGDVKETSDKYEQEKHEERVEELNQNIDDSRRLVKNKRDANGRAAIPYCARLPPGRARCSCQGNDYGRRREE